VAVSRPVSVTAQRRDEVGAIEFDEFDLKQKQWIIRRERAKNNKAHEVALSALAVAVLKTATRDRPPIDDEATPRWLFSTTGTTPVSGLSKAKQILDAEMERQARKARNLPEDDEELRKAQSQRRPAAICARLDAARFKTQCDDRHGRAEDPATRHRSRAESRQRHDQGRRRDLERTRIFGRAKGRAGHLGPVRGQPNQRPRWQSAARCRVLGAQGGYH
jgi:hypothetical protein